MREHTRASAATGANKSRAEATASSAIAASPSRSSRASPPVAKGRMRSRDSHRSTSLAVVLCEPSPSAARADVATARFQMGPCSRRSFQVESAAVTLHERDGPGLGVCLSALAIDASPCRRVLQGQLGLHRTVFRRAGWLSLMPNFHLVTTAFPVYSRKAMSYPTGILVLLIAASAVGCGASAKQEPPGSSDTDNSGGEEGPLDNPSQSNASCSGLSEAACDAAANCVRSTGRPAYADGEGMCVGAVEFLGCVVEEACDDFEAGTFHCDSEQTVWSTIGHCAPPHLSPCEAGVEVPMPCDVDELEKLPRFTTIPRG